MKSAWTWRLAIALILLVALQGVVQTEAVCSKSVGSRVFTSCQELQSLGATYAWTFNNATNAVDFAFSEAMQASGGWVGWGINPTGLTMEGTQALVAFETNAALTIRTYNVTLAQKVQFAPLLPGALSVSYTNLSATMTGDSVVTIFGSFVLAPGQSHTVNQVWNRGPSVNLATFEISRHDITNPANLLGLGSLDLSTGTATAGSIPHLKLRNTHGVINAVSWGILLPLGVMAARYLRPFAWADPLWFYVHVGCQLSGYALGVAGWGLGLRLQKFAMPIRLYHRNLGVAIFVLATLQVLALFLRPKKDSKYRLGWNVYHHAVGYATIILIIRNIFEGLKILHPASKWKTAYIVVISVLGGVSLVAEVVTWVVWFRRRRRSNNNHNKVALDDNSKEIQPQVVV